MIFRGHYVYNRGGLITGEETFEVCEENGLRRARVESAEDAPGGRRSCLAEAALDPSWRVTSLEIKTIDAEGESWARYRWDGDSLVGLLQRRGARREIGVPMAGELEISCPFASFDTIFFNRVALPVLSQRRVEFLQISPAGLDAVQTHAILERLEDADIDWKGGRMKAKRYAVTDAAGLREELQALPLSPESGVETVLQRADRYRLIV